MSRASSHGLTVAEGLLPLLDVSIMLLGLFLVLMAAGKLSPSNPADASSIAGIGQVVVLRIAADGRLFVQDGGEAGTGESVPLGDLSTKLRTIRERRGEKATIVLVHYEDVWVTTGPSFPEITEAIRASGCHYARTF